MQEKGLVKKGEGKEMHYGSEQNDIETSNHSLSHELGYASEANSAEEVKEGVVRANEHTEERGAHYFHYDS